MLECNISLEELSELINDITFYCRYDECENCPVKKYIKKDECCDNRSILSWLKAEVFINGSDGG